jgi:hypothetical protein
MAFKPKLLNRVNARLNRLQKNDLSSLQGLKLLKNHRLYVVPKGTTHKTQEFFRNL